MSGPYAAAALDLWSSGWRAVLPLPSGAKYPPPKGTTGIDGRDPSGADVWAWTEGRHRGGNVAIRLPDTVIGLDVDAYDDRHGAHTLERAEARWGALPATWRVTCRDDGISGIRLYRVPAGRRFVGTFGPGTETVQRVHRYVVAPPSIHPTGRVYRWAGPDGEGRAPRPVELPALPERWVSALTVPAAHTRRPARGRTRSPARARDPRSSMERLAARTGSHHPDWVIAQLDDHLRQLRKAATAGEARDLVAAVGFLGGQAVILRLVALDDFCDRFHTAVARTPLAREDATAAGATGMTRAKLTPWRLATTSA